MRSYVLTDAQGRTASGVKLEPGRFVQQADAIKQLASRLADSCCDTPLLAALVSPFPASQAKMFMINCWNVAVDPNNAQSYTVVKEMIPVPAVNLEQKLTFALLVLKEMCPNAEFRAWAGNWLSDEDRSARAAAAAREGAEKELHADVERVRHVARAAEIAASGGDIEGFAEIAKALSGLRGFAPNLNLGVLAERVAGATADFAEFESRSASAH